MNFIFFLFLLLLMYCTSHGAHCASLPSSAANAVPIGTTVWVDATFRLKLQMINECLKTTSLHNKCTRVENVVWNRFWKILENCQQHKHINMRVCVWECNMLFTEIDRDYKKNVQLAILNEMSKFVKTWNSILFWGSVFSRQTTFNICDSIVLNFIAQWAYICFTEIFVHVYAVLNHKTQYN